jgi:sulfur carrier protein ThiS
MGPATPASVAVEFAPQLRRHVDCPPQAVAPGSLRAVLEAALAAAPRLAPYVFDDQGAIRRHVAVFVNARQIADRAHLDQTLAPGDRVHVIQALTGG